MDGNSGPSGSSNQPSNTQQPKTKEPVQQVDWSADSNSHHIFPGTEGMNKQSMGQILNDGTNNGSMESKKGKFSSHRTFEGIRFGCVD
ncbi:unnamed protein product [Macrosiphum euphorbiae]|uniref:Uncharacterized protein n=1 Tax=Macrosiphum euphorbiae TaxID=13131 RepID=A0AAV0XU57_9HEMI|nr:unnamed protein product [Macrosiphum euphorbiae]